MQGLPRHHTQTNMNVAIGYVVALGCIFGAYILHHGNMEVIIEALPLEMMAILGGALGAFVVNNQTKTLKAVLAKTGLSRQQELVSLLAGKAFPGG